MEKEILKNTGAKKASDYGVSDELFELIRSRINLLEEEDIIVCNEISNATAETVQVHFHKVDELAKHLSSYCMVVDLTDADRPDAKTRAVINKRFSSVADEVTHISFCIGKSILLRTALRFVLHSSTIKNYSVCETLEQALENCRNARPRQAN